MFEELVKAFVWMLEAYAIAGIVFAAAFVSIGVQRLDSETQGSGLAFRLLIVPAAAAFWPVLLSRWVRGVGEPPVEKNPHRIG